MISKWLPSTGAANASPILSETDNRSVAEPATTTWSFLRRAAKAVSDNAGSLMFTLLTANIPGTSAHPQNISDLEAPHLQGLSMQNDTHYIDGFRMSSEDEAEGAFTAIIIIGVSVAACFSLYGKQLCGCLSSRSTIPHTLLGQPLMTIQEGELMN